MDDAANSYYSAAAQLPNALSCALLRVDASIAAIITEIRLRSDRPAVLTTPNGMLLVRTDGKALSTTGNAEPLLITSHAMLQTCFHAICAYSVHHFQNCIAQGFVPLSGGHRAGICGMAMSADKNTVQIENITSLNIRVARVHLCTCDARLQTLLLAKDGGILLVGAPASGKTTLLRAILQLLSNNNQRVATVDERFEIAPLEQRGFIVPQSLNCDILSGFAKATGMLQALRSLSPDVIVCDEIGTMADAKAIESVANSGVHMIATMHADGVKSVLKRPQMHTLLQTGAFAHLVILSGAAMPGKIKEVISLADIL